MEITGQLVLLVLCKIMEAIIRDKILIHFKVNMLFTDKQFGFIKGRSTTLQLLQNDIGQMDRMSGTRWAG